MDPQPPQPSHQEPEPEGQSFQETNASSRQQQVTSDALTAFMRSIQQPAPSASWQQRRQAVWQTNLQRLQSAWQGLQRLSMRTKIIGGLALCLAIVLCSTASALVNGAARANLNAGQASRTLSQPSATPLTATNTPNISATPTQATQPTAIPTKAPASLINGATLGGMVSAFDGALGRQDGENTWNATIGGKPAEVFVDTLAGTDSANHVYIVQVETPIHSGDTSETWSFATLSNYSQRFWPPDAKTLGTEARGGGQGETVYDLFSARLAATFPTKEFTNDSGSRQVQPGTLNWSCSLAKFPGGPTTGVNTCIIAIGTYN